MEPVTPAGRVRWAFSGAGPVTFVGAAGFVLTLPWGSSSNRGGEAPPGQG